MRIFHLNAIHGGSVSVGYLIGADDSDVDVLVEFDKNHIPSYFELLDMEEELKKLFNGYKVDLRTPGDLSRYFRKDVLKSAEVLFAGS